MLKFSFIGCGPTAKRHSEHLGYKQIEGARLVLVCENIFRKDD